MIECDEDNYNVSFVKTTHSEGVYKWPDNPDLAWICGRDIVKKLEPPIMSNLRMGYIQFDF